MGTCCLSASKYYRTISNSSLGSVDFSAKIAASSAVRLSARSMATSSAGSFASASLRFAPRIESVYHVICCGGTFTVLMMRFVESTSQSAMKR
jgi:hypothetical protein